MTTVVTLVRRLHQHRAWVNENLLSAAATLSDEPLRRLFPIGQGSIWKSLLHLYAGEFVWLEALLGDDHPQAPSDLPDRLPGNQLGEGGIASLAELRQKWGDLERRWQRYLGELSAESLDEPVYKVSTSSGAGSDSQPNDTTCCCTFARTPNTQRHRWSTCSGTSASSNCPRRC